MKQRIGQSFSRAAQTYEREAEVQRAVAEELASLIDEWLQPDDRVLDVGSGTGYLLRALSAVPRQKIALDISPSMLAQQANTEVVSICADWDQLPLANQTVDAVVSSFAWQWAHNFQQLFAECFRVLRSHGRLQASLPCQGTLRELATSWQLADPSHDHVNQFPEAQDIRSALAAVGFSDIEIQQRQRVQYFSKAEHLLAELKALGVHQVTGRRAPGLLGRRRLQSMISAYEQFRCAQGVPASWCYLLVSARKTPAV